VRGIAILTATGIAAGTTSGETESGIVDETAGTVMTETVGIVMTETAETVMTETAGIVMTETAESVIGIATVSVGIHGTVIVTADGIVIATGIAIEAETVEYHDRLRTSSVRTAARITRGADQKRGMMLQITEMLRSRVSRNDAASQNGTPVTLPKVCQIGFGISSSSRSHLRGRSWDLGREA